VIGGEKRGERKGGGGRKLAWRGGMLRRWGRLGGESRICGLRKGVPSSGSCELRKGKEGIEARSRELRNWVNGVGSCVASLLGCLDLMV
jgi:hypothetical protein